MQSTVRKTLNNLGLGLLPFAVVLTVWWIASQARLVPDWLLPSPMSVGYAFWKLCANGVFPKLLSISALNVLPPFFIALFMALAVGIVIAQSSFFARLMTPFLAAFYPIPSIAWLPLIILFFGFSRWSIWIMIFLSSFLRMIYGVVSSVQGVRKSWLMVARNYNLSRFAIIFRIVIPGTFPYLLATARSGFGTAWRALIGAEMLVVTLGGLGKFIWQAQGFFNFDYVLAGIILIGFVGVAVELWIFRVLEKRVFRQWGINYDQW